MFSNKRFIVPDKAMIQAHKKAVPYTIIPIGGPEDLLKWRKDQELMREAREAILKPIRQATRDRVVSMVANQNANITADEVSKMELTQAKVRRGLDKPIKGDLAQPGDLLQFTKHKTSLRQKLSHFCRNLWKSAFDSE